MDLQNEKGDVVPEWLYCVMDAIDEESVCYLRNHDKEYQDVKQQMEDMYKQYPFIDELFDGDGAVNLSVGEHKILLEYLQLQLKMDFRERKLYYWFGHMHCYDYFVKLGALKGMEDKNKE